MTPKAKRRKTPRVLTKNEDDIARFVSGLLSGQLDSIETFDDARNAVSKLINKSTLWEAADIADDTGRHTREYEALALPAWRNVNSALSPELAANLVDSWKNALPKALDKYSTRSIRVVVGEPEDAYALRKLDKAGEIFIAPTLFYPGKGFRWRWPFRVGVIDHSGDWLSELRDHYHHGKVYIAEPFDPTTTAGYEIVILDPAMLDQLSHDAIEILGQVACIIGVNDQATIETLAIIASRIDPSIAIAFPAPPEHWWNRFYHELSHDQPLDVAATRAHSGALVAGPVQGLDATSVGRWAMAATPHVPILAGLADELPSWDFTREDGAARGISDISRSTEAMGNDVTVTVGMDESPIPVPRRLITEFWHGDKTVRSVLPPSTLIDLEVKIAIPEKGQIAAEAPFPESVLRGHQVKLTVVVTSDVFKTPQSQEIGLPMGNPAEPSTPALFRFKSPESGSLVSFDIVVRYEGHPLQAATLTASVRERSIPSDRPRLRTYTLSGPSEPTPEAKPIEFNLNAQGADLIDDKGIRLPLIDVQAMLDAFETMISRVLGDEKAPMHLKDDSAHQLLIDLARKGVELSTMLGVFDGLDKALSVNLLVAPSTRILPLELVYQGVAPRPSAKLCQDHIKTPPPAGQPCERTSARIVCPYAFWGLHRKISRSVKGGPHDQPSNTMRLVPSPVLYGATSIADFGATSVVLPSDSVENKAQELFGTVARVTSWTAWKKVIKNKQPQLLLLLSHTQKERGEVKLHLGKTSYLARPDIRSDVIRADGVAPPLVVLIACASATVGDPFGTFPGVLIAKGAGAVVGTLAKINGPQGAAAAATLLDSLQRGANLGHSLADALTMTRRALIGDGLVAGLILVSHGELDARLGS